MLDNIFKNKKAFVALDNGKIQFEIDYHEDSLTWTDLPNKEQTETDKALAMRITDDLHNISWIEENGVVVSHVIDLKAGKVWATWTWNDESAFGGRGIQTHEGTFEFI